MRMCHATHVNESLSHVPSQMDVCDMTHPYMRHVMLRIWTSHVTHMDETCDTYGSVSHTYESVISHVRKFYVTHVNESLSSMPSHMDESCHTYE